MNSSPFLFKPHDKTMDEESGFSKIVPGGQLDKALLTGGGAYVFTRPNGLPLVPQEVTKAFTGFVMEHNLPHLTTHAP